ncbi:hypothetical protein JZ751_028756 [Albula glossodonta]|uniref:Ig-like domain-containing protein n=1 Tax=Albula glossodonta TaxID=121402 RepID=A0A8T2MWN4_9TELE|nr:hypothetical protein JZ751_028756 [Albula glossodonta]
MDITVVRIMVLLPLFTLICCAGGLAELCRVVITQPAELSASVGADSVVLPCSLQHSCPNTTATVRWLRFYHSSHQQLSDHPPKYNLQDQTLTIQSPLANDSGIYYCAIDLTASQQQGAPSIGSGTLLVVTGECSCSAHWCVLSHAPPQSFPSPDLQSRER